MAICTTGAMEEFTLTGYNNGSLTFTGRLFSEGSFFDSESGSLTRLRLFAMEDNRLVYYVVSTENGEKDRRVYVLTVDSEVCRIDNGQQSIVMPMDLLFSAVFGLCGMEESQQEELRSTLQESLRAVGA
ncbi:hypothetical protein LJB93_01550 [Desulfovibrio sp. OttesenSCG-928-F07]|nr:hypothetical protein [Desulfovibrio sp. OttesenSCG-928-F07]